MTSEILFVLFLEVVFSVFFFTRCLGVPIVLVLCYGRSSPAFCGVVLLFWRFFQFLLLFPLSSCLVAFLFCFNPVRCILFLFRPTQRRSCPVFLRAAFPFLVLVFVFVVWSVVSVFLVFRLFSLICFMRLACGRLLISWLFFVVCFVICFSPALICFFILECQIRRNWRLIIFLLCALIRAVCLVMLHLSCLCLFSGEAWLFRLVPPNFSF